MNPIIEEKQVIEKASEILINAKCGVELTGAGMSVESGLPDFKEPNGLYTKYNGQFAGSAVHQNPCAVNHG